MAKEPIKKTTTKKTTAKKTAVAKKKTTTKKRALKTSIVAYVDVGFGNTLYIRGEGAGLSWEKGIPLKNISSTEWIFEPTQSADTITYKFLINDLLWAEGDDLTIKAGSKSVSLPRFDW